LHWPFPLLGSALEELRLAPRQLWCSQLSTVAPHVDGFQFCNPLELDLHGFALLSPVEQLLSPVEHLLPHSLSCYEQQPCRYRWTRRTRIRPEYDKEAHYNIEKMN
jgi:hypothetical protein